MCVPIFLPIIRGVTSLKTERLFNCLAKKFHQKYNKINLRYHKKNFFAKSIHSLLGFKNYCFLHYVLTVNSFQPLTIYTKTPIWQGSESTYVSNIRMTFWRESNLTGVFLFSFWSSWPLINLERSIKIKKNLSPPPSQIIKNISSFS